MDASGGRGHKRTESVNSPLKQTNTGPIVYEAKIVQLYERLFDETVRKPPGFWVELFILPVDAEALVKTLEVRNPLSDYSLCVRLLVQQAVSYLKLSAYARTHSKAKQPGVTGSDAIIVENTLQTLQIVFTEAVEQLKSSDLLVQTLTSDTHGDTLFNELGVTLLMLLQHGDLRDATAATKFVRIISQSASGTRIVVMLTSKNFFAPLIRVLGAFPHKPVALDALIAIGILTAVNRFEFDAAPVYQQRIGDFVDETLMMGIVAQFQHELRAYVLIESTLYPSQPENTWMNRSLGWFASLVNKDDKQNTKVEKTTDIKKADFTWPIMLPLYEFVAHNSIFAQLFASSPAMGKLIEVSALAAVFVRRSRSKKRRSLLKAHIWLGTLTLRRLVETCPLQLVDEGLRMQIRVLGSKNSNDTSRRLFVEGIFDFVQSALRNLGVDRSNIRRQSSPNPTNSLSTPSSSVPSSPGPSTKSINSVSVPEEEDVPASPVNTSLKSSDHPAFVPPSPLASMKLPSRQSSVDMSSGLASPFVFPPPVQNPQVDPLDWKLLHQLVVLVYQVCSTLSETKHILQYAWSSLFQTFFSLLKHWSNLPPAYECKPVIELMLTVITGMSLRRDLLPEEEWRETFFMLVRSKNILIDLNKVYPALKTSIQEQVINVMTGQYDTNKVSPDFGAIMRHAALSAHGDPGASVSEKQLPYSEIGPDSSLRSVVQTELRGGK